MKNTDSAQFGFHEKAFVESFVLPQKKQRLLELLVKPKRRKKGLDELNHQNCLDSKYMNHIEPRYQEKTIILEMLRKKGSPEVVYVFSNNPQLDGREFTLEQALEQTIGKCDFGTVISCIPGKLAYFEDEDIGERYILSKDAI